MSEFPFASCNENDFNDLFQNAPVAEQFTDLLSSHDFREVLAKYTSNDEIRNLNCNYYTADEFNTKFEKMNKNIECSVLHLNIRSLNSKLREFCTLINLLSTDWDCIVLSEIWAYNLDFYKNILNDYYLFYDLPLSSSIGGVGMFVKKNLNPKLRNEFNIVSNNTLKCESLLIELTKNKNKIIVGGIYRHPNQNIDLFANSMQIILEKISKQKWPCIISGDINLNLLHSEKSPPIENYLNNLILHNFMPVILFPTRISTKSATLIDHIYYFEGCYAIFTETRLARQHPRTP